MFRAQFICRVILFVQNYTQVSSRISFYSHSSYKVMQEQVFIRLSLRPILSDHFALFLDIHLTIPKLRRPLPLIQASAEQFSYPEIRTLPNNGPEYPSESFKSGQENLHTNNGHLQSGIPDDDIAVTGPPQMLGESNTSPNFSLSGDSAIPISLPTLNSIITELARSVFLISMHEYTSWV